MRHCDSSNAIRGAPDAVMNIMKKQATKRDKLSFLVQEELQLRNVYIFLSTTMKGAVCNNTSTLLYDKIYCVNMLFSVPTSTNE